MGVKIRLASAYSSASMRDERMVGVVVIICIVTLSLPFLISRQFQKTSPFRKTRYGEMK